MNKINEIIRNNSIIEMLNKYTIKETAIHFNLSESMIKKISSEKRPLILLRDEKNKRFNLYSKSTFVCSFESEEVFFNFFSLRKIDKIIETKERKIKTT